ncbi:MAG: glycosyltransferase family 39 protein [Microgenomates group bacterium]
MKRTWILVVLIVLIAAAVRLWHLGLTPPSPDWDEAALGYNAYSMLLTGKDEYGTPFPLSLRSFDDYKPPLYMYMTIPSVAIFGLSVWSTRLPSAVMGILAVIGTFLFVRELLRKWSKDKKIIESIPLIAAFLLAISPWHIQFSRIAFEANTGVTLNIWAAFFFLRNKKTLWMSALLFGLSLYAYHSERIFAPMFLLLLTILDWKEIWANKKSVYLAIAIGLLTVIPMIVMFTNPTTLMRLKGTSSLSDQTALLSSSVRLLEDDIARGDTLGMVFDNRRIVWVKTVVDGYLSHFSLKWLFLQGDLPRHHAPDMGLLYLIELPFLLWGIVSIAKRGGKLAVFLFVWILLAPIPASVTTGLPHAIRTLVFLPVFQILTAFGIYEYIVWIRNGKRWKKLTLPIILFLALCNIVYYLHMYFVHMDREYSDYWQYGYQQAVEYAETNKNAYTKVVVSTKLEQPHMFFLFYTKYDPKKYQSEGGTASGGFREVKNHFDVYDFRPIQWDKEIKDGSTLYIGTPSEIPDGSLGIIKYLDGRDAIHIAK